MRAALDRWAPRLAAVVLLAGVASYTATRLVGGSSAPATPSAPAGVETVPLDPKARAVAEAFVATAVARRHLEQAWQLAAPALRGSMTLAEWRTGSIPVQPYPVGQAKASYTVKDSHPDDALLQVTFEPRPASNAQPAAFLIDLARIGGHWLVSGWSPSSVVGPGG